MTGLYILCLAVGSIMSEVLFKTDPYVIIVQLLNGSSSPQSPCSSSPCKNEGTCVPSYINGIFSFFYSVLLIWSDLILKAEG